MYTAELQLCLGWLARLHLTVYNTLGAFSNADYNRDVIKNTLKSYFDEVEVPVIC